MALIFGLRNGYRWPRSTHTSDAKGDIVLSRGNDGLTIILAERTHTEIRSFVPGPWR
jgi:hypothetical protein